jgi:hypothetical protein
MMSGEHLIYVPGTWCCPKCQFTLVQSNLNAVDGTVTARDEPGDKCPNCDSPLWRVSWQQQAKEMGERAEQEILRSRDLQREVDRLSQILNSPIVEPFVLAAVNEAAHQVYRWGEDHDAQKTAWDWFWTLCYLGGKAAHAALACDWQKAKHHTVTAAAMLANWHAQIVAAEHLNTLQRPERAQ